MSNKYFSHMPPAELMRLSDKGRPRISVVYTNTDQRFIIVALNDGRKFFLDFSWFETASNGTTPDFLRVEVIDYGWTLSLGEYEASIDSIIESDNEIPQFIANLAMADLNPVNQRKMLDVLRNCVSRGWGKSDEVDAIDLLDDPDFHSVLIQYRDHDHGKVHSLELNRDCTEVRFDDDCGDFSPLFAHGWLTHLFNT